MTGNNMQMCNLQIKFITLLKYKMVENNTSDLTRIGLPNKVHAPSNLYQNNFIFSLCYFPIDNGAMIFLFPCQIVVLCFFVSIEQVNNLREIQAMRRLSPHPNILQLFEVLL